MAELDPPQTWVLVLLLTIAVCVFTINPLVIAAILCNASVRHKSSNLFILNLVMIDLVMMTLVIIRSTLDFSGYQEKESCLVWIVLFRLMAVASMLSNFSIACDRFTFIHKPLHYPIIVTRSRVLQIVSSIWIVSLALGTIAIYGTQETPSYEEQETILVGLGVTASQNEQDKLLPEVQQITPLYQAENLSRTDMEVTHCYRKPRKAVWLQGIIMITLYFSLGVLTLGMYVKLFFVIRKHCRAVEHHSRTFRSSSHPRKKDVDNSPNHAGRIDTRLKYDTTPPLSDIQLRPISQTPSYANSCSEYGQNESNGLSDVPRYDITSNDSDIDSDHLIVVDVDGSLRICTENLPQIQDVKANRTENMSEPQDARPCSTEHNGNTLYALSRDTPSSVQANGNDLRLKDNVDNATSDNPRNVTSNFENKRTAQRVCPVKKNDEKAKKLRPPQSGVKKCRHHLSDLRIINSLIFMFAIYFICWTPAFVISAMSHLFQTRVNSSIEDAALIFLVTNSMWNFPVFVLRKTELRQSILGVVKAGLGLFACFCTTKGKLKYESTVKTTL